MTSGTPSHIEIDDRGGHDDLPGIGEDRGARPRPLQNRGERSHRRPEITRRGGAYCVIVLPRFGDDEAAVDERMKQVTHEREHPGHWGGDQYGSTGRKPGLRLATHEVIDARFEGAVVVQVFEESDLERFGDVTQPEVRDLRGETPRDLERLGVEARGGGVDG